MCGIFGFIDTHKGISDRLGLLRLAIDSLNHRGPDAFGEWVYQKVYFGHRRLSVIDLSTNANQPFESGCGDLCIVFNGEIYNYLELSKELPTLRTKSDTEVIIEGYKVYGIDFFSKLKGIFAFAIYDKRGERLVLCRDRAGVKPLYFLKKGELLAFGSEIKALVLAVPELTVNEGILKSYLALGYCLEPGTIYNEIQAIRPGGCYIIDARNGRSETRNIGAYVFDRSNELTFNENVSRTQELIKSAVRRNLVSDVSVNFSLSGGIDSSLVAALGNSERSGRLLTVKFDDEAYDESSIALEYAARLGTELDIINIKHNASLELVNGIFSHFDQPYADSSAIPFYFLSKAASRFGKVLLGGDGGDEIQNGYPSFGWFPLVDKFSALNHLRPFLSTMEFFDLGRKIDRMMSVMAANGYDDKLCEWNSWIPPGSRLLGIVPWKFDPSIIYRQFASSFADIHVSGMGEAVTKNYFLKRMLSDYLRKSDMMSMMHGLEYRVPLLDEDLVSFSLSIPYNQKSTLWQQKRVFRAIHSTIFGRKLAVRPKTGFSIPLDSWLSKDDFRLIESITCSNKSIVSEYVQPEYVKSLFRLFWDGRHSGAISRGGQYQRILLLYNLEMWRIMSKR